MGPGSSHRRIATRRSLVQLEQFPTVSPFLRSFYGLLLDWIEESRDDLAEIQTAFTLLLRIEVRHHEAVAELVDADAFDLFAFLDVSRRTQEMLQRLRGAILNIPRSTRRHEMIRHLLLAECHYHLGRPERVVPFLRAAIGLGAAHPMTNFALGYNLYSHALHSYVRRKHGKSRFVVTDAPRFQRLIRGAIEAFRQALSGDPFDGQICWWIGQLSEVIRQRADAWTAYCRSAQSDPARFGGPVSHKLAKLRVPVLDALSAAEGARLDALPPIADEDISAMRDRLQEMTSSTDLFGDT